MFTDIVGYTALMGHDEKKALEVLENNRQIQRPIIEEYRGRWIKELGDGVMASFNAATDAVYAAIKIQQACSAAGIYQLRIGIALGEIVFENEDIFGEGVNVAARIQSVTPPGAIWISESVHSNVINKNDITSEFVNAQHLKNVSAPVRIYRVIVGATNITGERGDLNRNVDNHPPAQRGTRILIALGLTFLLASSVLFFLYYNRDRSGLEHDKSIAVLPFTDFSQAKDQEWFCDGMMEEILNHLSKVKDLQVISRTSSMKYKGAKISLEEIGRDLGVATVLEGSVRKKGEKIRITVQLINAKSGHHLWSEDYDYQDGNDIFAVQTDVSENVVTALKARLTSEEKGSLAKRDTDNPQAYKFYRKGRHFWDNRTKASFDSAEMYYKKAVELDPDYALAYSGLADLYIYPNSGLSQLEAIPIAKDYATRALALDNTLGEALSTLGFIESAFDYDWIKSKRTLEKSIALNNNNPTAHLFYGNLLQYTGQNTQKGIQEIKRALALDPLSANLNYVLGRNYYLARQYDSASVQLKKTLTLNPGFNLAAGNLAYVLLAKKEFIPAFEIIKQLESEGTSKIFYYRGPNLSYAYGISGDKINAQLELDKTLAENPNQSPYHVARAYLVMNDYDRALTSLEKAYQLRDIWMYILSVDPTFDPLRMEPRFIALLKTMNLDGK